MNQWKVLSGSRSRGVGTPGSSAAQTGTTEQDKKLKQYLEDERIALFLQNEEFMRELQRNREFLIALERGMKCCTHSRASTYFHTHKDTHQIEFTENRFSLSLSWREAIATLPEQEDENAICFLNR